MSQFYYPQIEHYISPTYIRGLTRGGEKKD